MPIQFSSRFEYLGQSIAHPSFDKKNQEIKIGKKKNRFRVLTAMSDPKFNIAGKIINSWNLADQLYRLLSKWLGYTIELRTEKNQIVLLNINSIVSRLHVDRQKITQAVKGKKTEEFLMQISSEERIKKVFTKINDVQINQKYDHLMPFFSIEEDQLVYKDSGIATGFTSQELKEGIREAYELGWKPKEDQKKSFKFWKNEKGLPTYLVKKLGGGTYGKAYLFFDLNHGVTGVLKDARRKGNDDVIRDAKPAVENEYTLLTQIHQDKIAWGIQSAPSEFRTIRVLSKSGQIKERYGFLGLRYDCDYDGYLKQKINEPFQSRLIEFHQLLSGLKRLDELNLLHGDIKPENILCKKTPTFWIIHIADMGGACFIHKAHTLRYLIAGEDRAYTTEYHSENDYQKSLALARRGNKAQLIENEKKRDGFSMGIALYKALTGKYPFPLDNKRRPILTDKEGRSTYQPMNRPDVPIEFEELIQSMLTKDSMQRISAAEAFASFETFVAKEYPAIYAQIQNEMLSYEAVKIDI